MKQLADDVQSRRSWSKRDAYAGALATRSFFMRVVHGATCAMKQVHSSHTVGVPMLVVVR